MFQGEILPLLSHKNPWGHMEMCIRHITVGCSYSTQSEMTEIVRVSDHMLVFSLKLHKLNPYTGFTPIKHDCAIYYTATKSRDLRTYIC